jgi:hypothetical protein
LRTQRIREGIRIFNRYNGLLTIDEERGMSHRLYTLGRNLLKPYRFFLRLTTFS